MTVTAAQPPNAITGEIARFAMKCGPRDISEQVLQRAKLSFLDTLGLAIAGMSQSAPQILATVIRDARTKGGASVLCHEFQCDPASAALVNGAAADILGWSDISVIQMTHPSVSICPVVWAVGESLHADGSEILAAHVVGTEVANKIGAGVRPGLQQRGWHPLAVLNTFGAAAAAGKLLGLGAVQMQNALGIAAGEASGMRVAMGTMSKAFGAGRSARDGIRAAYLAQRGFTGPVDVLEARDGFLQTFGDGASGAGILEHLGAPFEFVSPGIALKKFPACTRSHNAIQALLDLRAVDAFAACDVDRIECLVTPAVMDYLKYHSPKSGLEAKYSMEYCLAVVLLDGRLGVDSFADERTQEAGMRALMSRIEMRVWDEYARHGYNPAHAPYGCKLEVHLRDGRVLSKQADHGPWEPETPPSWADVAAKFSSNVEWRLGHQCTENTIATIANLEHLQDFATLVADIQTAAAKSSRRDTDPGKPGFAEFERIDKSMTGH
ncbi:MAG TPA: MmgE/PrpD family protein [Vicinamibacterales bacterium]|nr:MmgE/PrpD family protein [Vicinamibacterales bacterium]